MNKIVPGLLIAASIFYTSCSDEYTICDTPLNVALNAGFYKNNGRIDTTAQPSAFSLAPLNGTPILTNASNRAGFYAPLNSAADTSKFVLSIEGNIPDTFQVAYTTQVQTISVNCGDINIFRISAIATTHHAVDSIQLINPVVNTSLQQNIRIFY